MLVFSPSYLTFQSRYADYHRPTFAPRHYYNDVVAEAEYEYAIAHARAEAARRNMERQMYIRQYRETRMAEEASSGGNMIRFHTVRGSPNSSFIRDREFEEKHRQTLTVQQCRREQECPQALARQFAEHEGHVQAQRQALLVQKQTEQLLCSLQSFTSFLQASDTASDDVLLEAYLRNLSSELAGVPSSTEASPHTTPPDEQNIKSVDRNGKNRETPAIPFPKSVTACFIPAQPTIADMLKERKARKTDVEMKGFLDGLPSTPAISDNSAKSELDVKAQIAASSSIWPSEVGDDASSRTAELKRTGAISPAVADRLRELLRSKRTRKVSLRTITEIEEALRVLESSFIFPSKVDFVRPERSDNSDSEIESSLAYSSNNRPIHEYEHALNMLMEKLDAVESHGDPAVRGRRKEAVNEVEKALKDVERKVEESRERASLTEKDPLRDTVLTQDDVLDDFITPSGDFVNQTIVAETVATVPDLTSSGSSSTAALLPPIHAKPSSSVEKSPRLDCSTSILQPTFSRTSLEPSVQFENHSSQLGPTVMSDDQDTPSVGCGLPSSSELQEIDVPFNVPTDSTPHSPNSPKLSPDNEGGFLLQSSPLLADSSSRRSHDLSEKTVLVDNEDIETYVDDDGELVQVDDNSPSLDSYREDTEPDDWSEVEA